MERDKPTHISRVRYDQTYPGPFGLIKEPLI